MGGKDQEARVVDHGGEGGGLGGVAPKNVNDPLCNSFPFFLLGSFPVSTLCMAPLHSYSNLKFAGKCLAS